MMPAPARLLPVYYFPEADVRLDLLEPSDWTSPSRPTRGQRPTSTCAPATASPRAPPGAYRDPKPGSPDTRGYSRSTGIRMDAWYEEDDRLRVHARDPYLRVDTLHSSRHVEVARRRPPRRGHPPPGAPRRDRPGHALLHPQGGRSPRSPRPERHLHALPVQGAGRLLLGAGRGRRLRGRGLVLPPPAGRRAARWRTTSASGRSATTPRSSSTARRCRWSRAISRGRLRARRRRRGASSPCRRRPRWRGGSRASSSTTSRGRTAAPRDRPTT